MNEEKPTHTPKPVRCPSTNYRVTPQPSTSTCCLLSFPEAHSALCARSGGLPPCTDESGAIYCFWCKQGTLPQTSAGAGVHTEPAVNGSSPLPHPRPLRMLMRLLNPHWFISKIAFDQASTFMEKLTNYFTYAFENITCIQLFENP